MQCGEKMKIDPTKQIGIGELNLGGKKRIMEKKGSGALQDCMGIAGGTEHMNLTIPPQLMTCLSNSLGSRSGNEITLYFLFLQAGTRITTTFPCGSVRMSVQFDYYQFSRAANYELHHLCLACFFPGINNAISCRSMVCRTRKFWFLCLGIPGRKWRVVNLRKGGDIERERDGS